MSPCLRAIEELRICSYERRELSRISNCRECRRFSHTWKSHRRDRTGWLGSQDSNLEMPESKADSHHSFANRSASDKRPSLLAASCKELRKLVLSIKCAISAFGSFAAKCSFFTSSTRRS